MSPINRIRQLALALPALIGLQIHAAAPVCTASVSGYTIIDLGPYSLVRNETGAARKVMPSVSNSSPTSALATNSSSQGSTTSDPSGGGATLTTHVQSATIEAYASAEVGAVHVRAHTSAVASPPSILSPDGVPFLPSPYSAIANVDAYAETDDTLTIGSGSLTNGTVVQWTWNLYADGTQIQSGYNHNYGVGPILPFTLGYRFANNVQLLGHSMVAFDPEGYTFKLQGSLVVTAKVGDVVPIYTSVDIGGAAVVDAAHSATSAPTDWSSDSAIDISHTAGMWFSDIPTGVQISSASGFDYGVNPNTRLIAPSLSLHCSPGCAQADLCWKSQSNVSYQVQYLSIVDATQWNNLGLPMAGNGTTNCLSAVIVPAQAQQFYRVVVSP